MTLFVYLILSPLLLVISVVFYYFQPKKINNYYGYRTRRSMLSTTNWELANEYSSRLFVIIAILLNIIQFISYIIFSDEFTFIFTAILMVFGLIAIIPLTERYLDRKGD